MNRIIFLGTAGDVEVMARQQRASGGIILQLDGYQFHLDPGPGSLVMAKDAKVSTRDTIAILASNDSILRSNDMAATVSAMSLDGIDPHGVLLASQSALERLPEAHRAFVEGLLPVTPRSKVGVNSITIIPTKTAAKDPTGVGFLLSTNEVTIGYTGDTSFYETMGADFGGCHVLILNVKHPAGTREEGHLNVEDAERLLKEVKPQQAILTGFGSKLLKQDPREAARELQRSTKVHTIAASDLLKVELEKRKK